MNPVTAIKTWKRLHYIEGWFTVEMALTFAMIDALQKQHQISGNLFEIGVHHGKSAIFLAMMLDPAKENLRVCDIFDDQEQNISVSGKGEYQAFMRNFEKVFSCYSFLKVFKFNSSLLSLKDTSSNCRLFHIDGGHNANEVYKDICTALSALNDNGVIVLDDIMSTGFPGVFEGFAKFMNYQPGELVPYMIAFNKLYLVRPSAYALYADLFNDGKYSYWSFIPQRYCTMKRALFYDTETFTFWFKKSPISLIGYLNRLYLTYPGLKQFRHFKAN